MKTGTLHVIRLKIRQIVNPTPSIATTTQTSPLQINQQCVPFWSSCDPDERYPPLSPHHAKQYGDTVIPSSCQAIPRCRYPLIPLSDTTMLLSPHPAKQYHYTAITSSRQRILTRPAKLLSTHHIERSPRSHDAKKPSPHPAEQHI